MQRQFSRVSRSIRRMTKADAKPARHPRLRALLFLLLSLAFAAVLIIAMTFFVIGSAPRSQAVAIAEGITISEFAALPDEDAYPAALAIDVDWQLYTGSYQSGALWSISPAGDVREIQGSSGARRVGRRAGYRPRWRALHSRPHRPAGSERRRRLALCRGRIDAAFRYPWRGLLRVRPPGRYRRRPKPGASTSAIVWVMSCVIRPRAKRSAAMAKPIGGMRPAAANASSPA